jgi:O-antigen ligase
MVGVTAVGAVLLVIYSPVAIAVLAGVAIFFFSAIENETALLLNVFLLPFAWVIRGDLPVSNIVVPARDLSVLAFFVGRAWRWNLRLHLFRREPITIATLIFFGVCVGSVAWGSTGWTHSSARALTLATSYMLFYLFVLEWVDTPARMQKVMVTLFLSTLFVSLFGILQEGVGGYTSLWLHLYTPDEAFIDWNNRVPSFLGYSNLLAGYLNLILPSALGCCFLTRGKWRKLGWWAAVLGTVALVLTQSRAGLVAFGCVLLLAIFHLVESRPKRTLLMGLLAAGWSAIYLIGKVLSPEHLGSVVAREPMERLLFWATAWRMFLAAPVFGIGMGNYSEVYGQYIPAYLIPPRHFTANGLYFQIISEMGLVGLLSFLSLAGIALVLARRQLKSSPSSLTRVLGFGILGGTVATLVHGLVDLALDVSPQWGTMYWLMLGLLAASTKIHMAQPWPENCE